MKLNLTESEVSPFSKGLILSRAFTERWGIRKASGCSSTTEPQLTRLVHLLILSSSLVLATRPLQGQTHWPMFLWLLGAWWGGAGTPTSLETMDTLLPRF